MEDLTKYGFRKDFNWETRFDLKKTVGDYVKEVNLLVDYKTRCEKAIKKINQYELIVGYYDYNDDGYDEIGENNKLQEELQNILEGKSDE